MCHCDSTASDFLNTGGCLAYFIYEGKTRAVAGNGSLVLQLDDYHFAVRLLFGCRLLVNYLVRQARNPLVKKSVGSSAGRRAAFERRRTI